MDQFLQDTSLPWVSIPMKVLTPGLWANRVISRYAEPGGEWIDVRYIGVQISTHNIVVEGRLSLIYLILHAYNHYTQQLSLDLFIPCPGIPAAMMRRGILGNGGWNYLLYFVFSGKELFVYVYMCESDFWKN